MFLLTAWAEELFCLGHFPWQLYEEDLQLHQRCGNAPLVRHLWAGTDRDKLRHKFRAILFTYNDDFQSRLFLNFFTLGWRCWQGEEEEGEVYEVLNIRTLKQATPNLRHEKKTECFFLKGQYQSNANFQSWACGVTTLPWQRDHVFRPNSCWVLHYHYILHGYSM